MIQELCLLMLENILWVLVNTAKNVFTVQPSSFSIISRQGAVECSVELIRVMQEASMFESCGKRHRVGGAPD